MKIYIKKKLLILSLLFVALSTNAQSHHFSNSASFGVTSPILDNGIGFHMGINPSYSIYSHISAEGQISYLYTKLGSSFLSGKMGYSNSVNTLIGGRIYFNSEGNTVRPFINFLAGVTYNKEESDGIKLESEFSPGLSGGIFLEFDKLLTGISVESPQHIVIKIGYGF